MLQVNWKLVYAKAEELYPRYKKGMHFSELEAELQQQGLDQMHIDYINEELVKLLLEEKQKHINWPLAVGAVVAALVLMGGLALLVRSGYILIGLVVILFLFIVLKMVFRTKHGRHSASKLNQKGDN